VLFRSYRRRGGGGGGDGWSDPKTTTQITETANERLQEYFPEFIDAVHQNFSGDQLQRFLDEIDVAGTQPNRVLSRVADQEKNTMTTLEALEAQYAKDKANAQTTAMDPQLLRTKNSVAGLSRLLGKAAKGNDETSQAIMGAAQNVPYLNQLQQVFESGVPIVRRPRTPSSQDLNQNTSYLSTWNFPEDIRSIKDQREVLADLKEMQEFTRQYSPNYSPQVMYRQINNASQDRTAGTSYEPQNAVEPVAAESTGPATPFWMTTPAGETRGIRANGYAEIAQMSQKKAMMEAAARRLHEQAAAKPPKIPSSQRPVALTRDQVRKKEDIKQIVKTTSAEDKSSKIRPKPAPVKKQKKRTTTARSYKATIPRY